MDWRRTTDRASLPLIAKVLSLALALFAASAAAQTPRPDVILVTIDTLRYDRLSIHGYGRPTSPALDDLMRKGAGFDQARVAEPLTGPSLISMITSRYPHQHAASRNGLRMRPKMMSLGRVLRARGYRTVAFVGNWTLRDSLCGLGEHFDEYHEIFSRKRWLGLFKSEATADDLTDAALDWVEDHTGEPRRKPFLLWVHYVDPHAPYRLHEELLESLRIPEHDSYPASDRYDTEVAFVDRSVGRLLKGLGERMGSESPLIVFAADHGESLGEHDSWGHGRHVYDMTLRVPMSFTWEGRIEPRRIAALASNIDIAPTVLGLLGLPQPDEFEGFDFSSVLLTGAEPPAGRVTFHQAHKGVSKGRSGEARQKGLLEVAIVKGAKKEIYRVKSVKVRRLVFDLAEDPGETSNLAAGNEEMSAALRDWLRQVQEGLVEADLLPTTPLDEESIEKMRALGYVE